MKIMKEENNRQVSVIIPIYNASEGLERCLDSLVQQTFRSLEVLFIDDCSTDDSLEKVTAFSRSEAVRDFSIKILRHEKNRGVAAARNTGLDHATGDFIYYLDADDRMEPDALEKMHREAEQTQADVVGCEWYLAFHKNERHMVQPEVRDGREAFVKMAHGVMRWNLWLFLVRRHLYEDSGFRFMEGMNMGEDLMVMMKLMLNAGKVRMLHQPLYHYIQTNSNSLTKEWGTVYQRQITANIQELERFAQAQCGKEYHTQLQCLKLNAKLPLLISFSTINYEHWLNWFPESNTYIFRNPDLPMRTRLLQFAASKRCFWVLKLYYAVVIKFVYGIIFK